MVASVYSVRSQFVHAGKKNVTIFGDMFEDHGLGSSTRPSLAQLRACLRRLILLEIKDHRMPSNAVLNAIVKL